MISNNVFTDTFYPYLWIPTLIDMLRSFLFKTMALHITWYVIFREPKENIILEKTCYFVIHILSLRPRKTSFFWMHSSFQVFLWCYSHTLYLLPPYVPSLPAASPIRENISCFFHFFFEIREKLTPDCLKFASGSYQTRMFDYLIFFF